MYLILLVSAVLINVVIAAELNHTASSYHGSDFKSKAVENKNNLGVPLWKQHFWKPHKSKVTRNASYIDRAENMIRFPIINQYEDKKKKILKKSPKRTIQKIIKKNRQKTKRIFVMKRTSSTLSPTPKEQGQDDMSWNENQTTMRANQKRRSKKYYSKLTRNPMPFQKLQKKKVFKIRERRNVDDREDLYILKDFDEMKFVKDDKDFSVVKTHIKKYW